MANTPLTPERAAVLGRIGGNVKVARYGPDAVAANARTGLQRRFEREVDPNHELTDEERARRAAHARTAYFTRIALLRHDRNRRERAAAEAGGA